MGNAGSAVSTNRTRNRTGSASIAALTRARLVAHDDDGFVAAARTRMAKRVRHERHPANCHERFRNTGRGAPEPRAEARGENHGLGDGRHTGNLNTKNNFSPSAGIVAPHVMFMLHFTAWPIHPIPCAGKRRRA